MVARGRGRAGPGVRYRGGKRERRKEREKKRRKEKKMGERKREGERDIRSAATAAARARALVGHGAAVGGTRCAEQGKERNETAIDSEI